MGKLLVLYLVLFVLSKTIECLLKVKKHYLVKLVSSFSFFKIFEALKYSLNSLQLSWYSIKETPQSSILDISHVNVVVSKIAGEKIAAVKKVI